MIRLADSHAHLNFPDFQEDLAFVLQRAREAGVEYINSIATRLTEVEPLLKLLEPYPHVYTSVGIHPHYAAEVPDDSVAAIVAHARHPKVVAVGETGFDLHYAFSPKERQERAFRHHIQAARELGLPLIVHTREAEADTRRVMEEERAAACGGVLHCFTGSTAMAHWALEQGFYLSFSGILTFKAAQELQETAKTLPLERLLIETDAPYLAPMPYRGKRNEPAWVVRVAETLATLLDRSVDEVARITTENYCRLFHVGAVPAVGQPVDHPPLLAYPIGHGLYINLTRACTLHCGFCPKWSAAPVVKGHDLTLRRHPSAAEVIAAMGDITGYTEIVFCGFGEPTLRLETLLEVAAEVKRRGPFRVRINTDGLANRVYGVDVTPRMQGLIDALSVSLNAQDAQTYDRICQPALSGSYEAVKAFIRAARVHVPEVVATAVQGVEGVDIPACRRIAEQELGVGFRARYLDRLG
ncbi:MAG: YchF/TatD family DNA exonuclease [Magnetococcales bacterium]|nr:YchF/TatD family DNA exonuclease [Magnetococcales bacterium]NGZ06746.1 YchF/TatD family DNA exonuclease [Magnetococcales bacterium]